MAPEQSVSDACGIASAEIDDLVAEIRQHVEAAGASLVSGEMPDLSGIVPSATAIIDRVAEGVTNPEVSAALDDVRSAIEGFGEVPAPDSLTGVPEYLTGLGAQLADLQSAAASLQRLCDQR